MRSLQDRVSESTKIKGQLYLEKTTGKKKKKSKIKWDFSSGDHKEGMK
jgi:hypothetical protein